MRILVENGGYSLRNMGDLAMLQVAIERLRARIPEAQFLAFTKAPELLQRIIPGIESVPLEPRDLLVQERAVFGALHRLVPATLSSRMLMLEDYVRTAWPEQAGRWIVRRLSKRGVECCPMREFVQLLRSCDACIATGGGYITDYFDRHALRSLQTLIMVQSMGRPTVLLGQGLGPVQSPRIRHAAARAIGQSRLIALREGRRGRPLLDALGVESRKIVVTGDDAIELAYRERPHSLGTCLGFNLRLADYSGLGEDIARRVGGRVEEWASRAGVRLIGIPIAFPPECDDVAALDRALCLDPQERASMRMLDTPSEIAKRVGLCRVVVTGSYHAAVFALSQGIPIIGVAVSPYYVAKFEGLREQFGEGCFVSSLRANGADADLLRLLSAAWDNAECLRPRLLAAAQDQISMGRTVYDKTADLIRSGVRS